MYLAVRACKHCPASYPAGTYREHKNAHPQRPYYGPARRTDRNSRILADLRAGLSTSVLAQKYGMSRQRVHQIWKATGEGGSVVQFREIPPYQVRCVCGDLRPRRGVSNHAESDRHQAFVRARWERRFWSRLAVRDSGCWEWTGDIQPTGYGRMSSMLGCPFPSPRVEYAHRIAYQLIAGPLADGLTIDHLCRNRACANPAHLDAVTHRENILRSPIAPAARNARKTHCIQGHPFDEANTRYSNDGRNRACRACHRIRSKGYVAPSRRKAAA